MYSESAKGGVEVGRSVGSQPLLIAYTPYDKGLETNMPKCFGTSEVFFCGHIKCPRRKASEELVSPWTFD